MREVKEEKSNIEKGTYRRGVEMKERKAQKASEKWGKRNCKE